MDYHFQDFSLRDVYNILFRQKKTIILFILCTFIFVVYGTFLSPEIFRSEAKLLLRIGRESVTLDPTATTGQTTWIDMSREQEINSEMEILKSRELADYVVEKIGVDKILKRPEEITLSDSLSTDIARNKVKEKQTRIREYVSAQKNDQPHAELFDELGKRDQAVMEVMGNFKADIQPMSSIIEMSFEAKSPETAYSVLSEIIEAFIEKHVEVHSTPGSHEFFVGHTNLLKNELLNLSDRMRDFKNKTGITSLDEQRTLLLGRINGLIQRMEANKSDLVASKSKVEALKRELTKLSNQIELNKSSNQFMSQDLYRLQLQEQELLSKYSENNIKVKDIRRQIAEAKKMLESNPQVTVGINTNYQQLQIELLTETANLHSYEAREREYTNQHLQYQEEIKNLNDHEAEFIQLERDRNIRNANYSRYSDNLEQARIDKELQNDKITNISILQSASLPMKPIKPRKILNIILGFFVAVLGGVGLAFLNEYIDLTIKSQEDVEEHLKLETLVAIPLHSVKHGYFKETPLLPENVGGTKG